MSVPTLPRRLDVRQVAIWTAVAILGAVAWAILALARGESVNAVWMHVAALCSYAITYRFYARFVANRVLDVDNRRPRLPSGWTTPSTSTKPTGGCSRGQEPSGFGGHLIRAVVALASPILAAVAALSEQTDDPRSATTPPPSRRPNCLPRLHSTCTGWQ
jgi:hypothetical protein